MRPKEKDVSGYIEPKFVKRKNRWNNSTKWNYAYRSKDGAAVIETTWHNVVCFEGKAVCPLQEIVKGDTLHVLGRLRRVRYLAESGEERFVVEVLASLVEKLPVAVYHPESS